MPLTSIDLFSGIGGFSAALDPLGVHPLMAVEMSPSAVEVYNANFNTAFEPVDVYKVREFPHVDILTAGFPCQPFSKAGAQRGASDPRGVLAGEVIRAVRSSRPYVVLLENVPNLYHRHKDLYKSVVVSLRRLGYSVSLRPVILSPDELPPDQGGTPQHRPRVFIAGTLNGGDVTPLEIQERMAPKDIGWGVEWLDGIRCDLDGHSPSGTDLDTITAWDRFYRDARSDGAVIPQPLWYDYATRAVDRPESPESAAVRWYKNTAFGDANPGLLERAAEDMASLPPSRRRFEWQAGGLGSVWDSFMTLRPSGLRCKRPTTVPAFTAMAQVPVIGPWRRRLSVQEGTQIQGMPPGFCLTGLVPDSKAWSLLGNSVHPGCVQAVLRALVRRDSRHRVLPRRLAEAVLAL